MSDHDHLSLLERLQAHVRQMAPHQQERQGGQLLVECLEELQEWSTYAKGGATQEYRNGFRDGIYCFAWMKDGVYYVGTGTSKLNHILIDVSKCHNFGASFGQTDAEEAKAEGGAA